MKFPVVLAVLLIAAAVPGVCQTVPDAAAFPIRLKAGGGFSALEGNLDDGRLKGATVWVDCMPCGLPDIFTSHGIGLEAEARSITKNINVPAQRGATKQATIGGGPTYTWFHYPNLQPYAKVIIAYGGMDFWDGNPNFQYVSLVIYQPGGGIDYRIYHSLWLRTDYEYQVWPHLFKTKWDLDPQGFTMGASWEFKAIHRRR
jgi:hypothetical protein